MSSGGLLSRSRGVHLTERALTSSGDCVSVRSVEREELHASFVEKLKRHWADHPYIDNYVVVCHGLTISVFLMRLLNMSIDQFYHYYNFTNCEFAVLEPTEVVGWFGKANTEHK